MRYAFALWVCICMYIPGRVGVRSRNAYQQLHLGLSVSSEPLFVREIESYLCYIYMYIAVVG